MKIERLGQDKIRIFLTFDDLMERGIQKDDMWREIPKVHDLFSEMMDQAYSEVGFEASGPLAVEVFAMPAQGMVVIVTKSQFEFHPDKDEEEDMYEMEVTLEQMDTVSYAFRDFEDVIHAAKHAIPLKLEGGSLYHYKDKWILQMEAEELEESKLHALIAILSEFGEAASVTTAMLEEYGKTVMKDQALKTLVHYF